MRIIRNNKVATFLVGIMMMAIVLSYGSQVQAAQDGDYTYTVTAGEAQITGYTGAGGVVTIPSTLAGFPVTSIEEGAFYNNVGLTSISIPQGITSIADYAFRNCTGLTSISIPQGVTSIGNFVFSDCGALTTISIPQGVTSIGNYAFYKCGGLTSINIPQGVTSIGVWAFSNCTGLTSISIPQGVTIIRFNAFSDCTGLTSVSIPESVTIIDVVAFSGCTGLTSISIPQEVTSTGYHAFFNCIGLTTIRFNSATTRIDDNTNTIPAATKIIGYAPSTAKAYALKYNRVFEVISVDKRALTTAIGNATTLIGSKTIGTAVGNVSQAAHDAYNEAITSATVVKDNAGASQAEVDAAVTAIATATTAFNNSIVIPEAVTGVSLNKSSSAINEGANENLSTNIAPTNATNKNVTWKSSDTTVATVDSNGKVIGVKAGTAVITVTTVDGSKTATCTVTVSTPTILVTGVALNKTSAIINVGANETLSATIAPTTATNKNVTWKSSNTAVAKVDSNGKVVGVSAGTAVITVTTVDGGKTATCTVTGTGTIPTRLAGTTAEQTAVAIAEQTGWTGAAILASSTSYGMVDALTAGPLASYLKTPILLTGAGNTLNADTKDELAKLEVETVYVTSGTAVIKQGVLDELKGMGIEVVALGGYDRYETSVNIAKKMTGVTKVAVANSIPDALSIASIASATNQPILLTDKDSVPASVSAYLSANSAITSSDVIGGTGVISDAVKARFPSATRHAGMTAYDTNSQVIQDFDVAIEYDNVYVANGVTGIDALAGAPLAAQTKSAIVLTDGKSVPAVAAIVHIKASADTVVTALGGEAVVSETIRAGVAAPIL